MKILVTGAAGFIGSHLCQRLLERGDCVAGLDNFDPYYPAPIKRANIEGLARHPGFSFQEADIRDSAEMERIFSLARPDRIIHLAACVGVLPSLQQPERYCDVNLGGTARLLELSRRHRVGGFLFASSSSVYGISSRVPFREDDPADSPISPYAVTKRAGELLCHAHHHNYGLPAVCLRFFTVFGPRQRPEMAIHKFASLIARGQPVPVFAGGASRRDYTYIDDILDGVLAALDGDFGFEIFNLGNSRPVGLLELISVLEECLGVAAIRENLPAQPGDVPQTCADLSKSESLLGYRPRISTRDGIARFVEWFRERPQPWSAV